MELSIVFRPNGILNCANAFSRSFAKPVPTQVIRFFAPAAGSEDKFCPDDGSQGAITD